MKNNDKKNLSDVIFISKKVLNIIYILLIVIALYIGIIIVKELGIIIFLLTILRVLSPLFLGIVIAWLLNPFVKWLETKKIRRGLGVAFSYLILIGCILLLIKSIIPLLYNQTIELVENLPNIISDLKDWIEKLLTNLDSNSINIDNVEKNIFSKLDLFSNNLTTSLPTLIINFLSSTISYIGSFVIGLVIGFYLLLSCNNIGSILIEIVPKKFRKGILDLTQKIEDSLRGYVNGALLDALLVFVVSSIAFAIIGLKSPMLFGLFCGLMNVIPYAGPYIGGAPAVIVGFSQKTSIGFAILIAIVIIQFLEGNILQTLIISKTTRLNPVIIIIGLLVFGHFFGIIGMLLSTPIIGVVKVIIRYFDEKYDLLSFSSKQVV